MIGDTIFLFLKLCRVIANGLTIKNIYSIFYVQFLFSWGNFFVKYLVVDLQKKCTFFLKLYFLKISTYTV